MIKWCKWVKGPPTLHFFYTLTLCNYIIKNIFNSTIKSEHSFNVVLFYVNLHLFSILRMTEVFHSLTIEICWNIWSFFFIVKHYHWRETSSFVFGRDTLYTDNIPGLFVPPNFECLWNTWAQLGLFIIISLSIIVSPKMYVHVYWI